MNETSKTQGIRSYRPYAHSANIANCFEDEACAGVHFGHVADHFQDMAAVKIWRLHGRHIFPLPSGMRKERVYFRPALLSRAREIESCSTAQPRMLSTRTYSVGRQFHRPWTLYGTSRRQQKCTWSMHIIATTIKKSMQEGQHTYYSSRVGIIHEHFSNYNVAVPS